MRGFGGPQMYFALERLMQRIAATRARSAGVLRRNSPVDVSPIAPAGAVLDSGDYRRRCRTRCGEGGLDELRAAAKGARRAGSTASAMLPWSSRRLEHGLYHDRADRRRARAGGPEKRRAGDGDDRARSARRGHRDVASVPQGQGHRTVMAQVVADVFGLKPEDIASTRRSTPRKDAWSIAAGNYSSRFARAVAGAAHLAAARSERSSRVSPRRS